eukprot:595018-Rhodomonas_salina.1
MDATLAMTLRVCGLDTQGIGGHEVKVWVWKLRMDVTWVMTLSACGRGHRVQVWVTRHVLVYVWVLGVRWGMCKSRVGSINKLYVASLASLTLIRFARIVPHVLSTLPAVNSDGRVTS